MTKTKTYTIRENPQRASLETSDQTTKMKKNNDNRRSIPETCDLWDADYILDN